MSRVLIIPDVHNAVDRAEAMVAAHGKSCDRIVFLGDYFDDYGDSPADVARAAEWLVGSVKDPKRIHLIGNHDVYYLAPYSRTWFAALGGGWQAPKNDAVRTITAALSIETLRPAAEIDGWLFSHAGFHRQFGQSHWSATDYLVAAETALRRAWTGAVDPIFLPGRARGGEAEIGGCTWLDWHSEFEPISGVHQIVGHTASLAVRVTYSTESGKVERAIGRHSSIPRDIPARGECRSLNWCVDTKLGCAAIIDGPSLEIIWH